MRPLALFLGSTALTALLSLTVSAQEYSNGGCGRHNRGEATKTPVEMYGVRPGGGCCPHGTVIPYYAPLSPTPTCKRFRTICYTPYYIGYCPRRLHGPKQPPYGADGWGEGPGPNLSKDAKFDNYGPYTTVLQDDTLFWRMGGNGLVPYGAPRPPHAGPPDIVDSIQASRQGGGGGGAPGQCAVNNVVVGPEVVVPAETPATATK